MAPKKEEEAPSMAPIHSILFSKYKSLVATSKKSGIRGNLNFTWYVFCNTMRGSEPFKILLVIYLPILIEYIYVCLKSNPSCFDSSRRIKCVF